MQPTPWLNRTFAFGLPQDSFGALYGRLREAPVRFTQTLKDATEESCALRPDGKWSVKENIGHLLVLETLWQQRFGEIAAGRPEMIPADLSNTATHEGGFNKHQLAFLTDAFTRTREQSLGILRSIQPAAMANKSVHPRLQQEMSITDMMYFVAEHDDHHLTTISNILKTDLP